MRSLLFFLSAVASLPTVGLRYQQFNAPPDYNWRGSKEHVLRFVVWYPAVSTAAEKELLVGPPNAPLFSAGRVAENAAPERTPHPLPLIVLSHGTGGSALQMAWLGTYLAAHGYLVAAINHPGNNAVTGYTTQGFVEGWERAKDVSTVITGLLADPTFGPWIDRDRIGAAGFSFGGYTMIELAGGRTNVARLMAHCGDGSCDPPELPGLAAKFKAMESQSDVQQALQRSGDSFRDPRIRAIFAIAPGVGMAFTPKDLAAIQIPVQIVVGSADRIAPPAPNAEFFAAHIKSARLVVLPGLVGHYTFLDSGTAAGKKQLPQLFVDNPGVDREQVHQQIAAMAAAFFDRELKVGR